MALSADQTAMLELLLGGQSYEELADLFGMDESEVRLRARTALAAIGGSDPDKAVPLSDYLLGKADPIDRADAVRHLKEDPGEHVLAKRILDGLAEIAPTAELVKLPSEPSGGRFLRKPPADAPAATTGTTSSIAGPATSSTPLNQHQKRLIAILGGAAIVLIAIVLAVTGAFSGSDGTGVDSGTNSTDLANGTDGNGNDTATIPLKGVGNKASGTATVGVGSGDQAFVDISIKGLDPSPKGKTYVVWMLLTKDQGYPLAPIQTDKNGNYENRFPVDSSVLSVVARVQNINVSEAPVSDLRDALKVAVKKSNLVISKVGDTVLDGAVPKSEQTEAPVVPPSSTPSAGTPTTPQDSTSTPSTTAPSTTAPDTSTGG